VSNAPISTTVQGIIEDLGLFIDFMLNSIYVKRQRDPDICDFVVGNPHEPAIPGFASALQQWAEPQRIDWFAYKMSEPEATEVAAASLRAKLGLPFDPGHITMTSGAFAGLNASLRAVCNPGDEVIYFTPPWFFYESIIKSGGFIPVRVPVNRDDWDLDLDAIRNAITPTTRAIIVNSPNNPTGRIYPPETLQGLSQILTEASTRSGRTIYLLSDEAYSHILVEGAEFHSPLEFYPASFLIYTYGKTLLAPGQRLGYVAISPEMPNPEQIQIGLLVALLTSGYGFPNAVLQYAVGDLEQLSIDIGHLNAKRDRMLAGLREAGYDVTTPQGTFYLLVRSPIEDDRAFAELLAEKDVFVLPGTYFELPGYFRISLTANMEMIDRGLPVFASVFDQVREAATIEVGAA
jgi:aspartate aminotransferase